MALSKDDQNTFIMIAGVLIVCVIALIAVLASIWQLIREPVNRAIFEIGDFFRLQTLDYNFAVDYTIPVTPPPPPPTPEPVAQPAPIPDDLNYNFALNLIDNDANLNNNPNVTSAIYTDAKLLEIQGNGEQVIQGNLSILIPKLKVNSPIVQGLNSEELLKQGFWVVPSNRKLGVGEIIMLCNRRFFGPFDSKSCWFLDQISKNDEIIVNVDGESLRYFVVGISVYNSRDPLIYSSSETQDFIKIVTTDPLYSNENRLVVLAQRQK